MASKIRVQFGDFEVEYEGPETFLEKKLPGLLDRLSNVVHGTLAESTRERHATKGAPRGASKRGTLATFLKTSKATTVQNRKFLAAAEWLHRGGKKFLATTDVTGALRDAQQSKLGNASQCLNNNVSQGFCEKDGKGFYVTDEGRDSLNK